MDLDLDLPRPAALSGSASEAGRTQALCRRDRHNGLTGDSLGAKVDMDQPE